MSADADQMFQVVQNLIQNVLQYTPDQGEAGVDIGIDGDRVEVRFSPTMVKESARKTSRTFSSGFTGVKNPVPGNRAERASGWRS